MGGKRGTWTLPLSEGPPLKGPPGGWGKSLTPLPLPLVQRGGPRAPFKRGGVVLPPQPQPPVVLSVLEAPKAPNIFDRPKARKKIWPSLLTEWWWWWGGGGRWWWWVSGSRGGGGVGGDPPSPPPRWCRVVKGSPVWGGGGGCSRGTCSHMKGTTAPAVRAAADLQNGPRELRAALLILPHEAVAWPPRVPPSTAGAGGRGAGRIGDALPVVRDLRRTRGGGAPPLARRSGGTKDLLPQAAEALPLRLEEPVPRDVAVAGDPQAAPRLVALEAVEPVIRHCAAQPAWPRNAASFRGSRSIMTSKKGADRTDGGRS